MNETRHETLPLEVVCDWCGQILTGQMRSSEVGSVVVVKVEHADQSGRPCLGSGRSIGAWPLSVELRETSVGFEIRIGEGRPRVYPSQESVIEVLRTLGVPGNEAVFWAATVAPGQPVTLLVPERRAKPRQSV